jgi:hypothetical protein
VRGRGPVPAAAADFQLPARPSAWYPLIILSFSRGFAAMRSLPLVIAAVFLAGCDGAPKVLEAPTPKYDPDAVATALLAELDKNGSGAIEPGEAQASPALAAAFADFDANRDKRITADEIRNRVELWAAAPNGSLPVGCAVRLDGQPLGEATVTFVPEKCMGDSIKTAVGKTTPEGYCDQYQIDGKTYRGLAPGLYRIQVTKDGTAIPARFNEQTVLGREVFHDARKPDQTIVLELTSR